MRQIALLFCLLLLAAPTYAKPGKESFVTRAGSISYDLSKGKVSFTIKPRKGGIKMIELKPSQVQKLKKLYDESFPLAKGKPDKSFTFKGLNTDVGAVLTFTRYGNDRRRAFRFKIHLKRGKPTVLDVSKGKDDLKFLDRFMQDLAKTAK